MKKIILYVLIFFSCLILSCKKYDSTPTEPNNKYGNVIGTAIDSVNNSPIIGAYISTDPESKSTNTDSLGKFLLSDIQIGNYLLKLNKTNYLSYSLPISVNEGKTTSVELWLKESPLNSGSANVEFNYAGYQFKPFGTCSNKNDSITIVVTFGSATITNILEIMVFNPNYKDTLKLDSESKSYISWNQPGGLGYLKSVGDNAGQIIITYLDKQTKTIKGDFSCTLVDGSFFTGQLSLSGKFEGTW